MRFKLLTALLFVAVLMVPSLAEARPVRPGDISVPDGYKIEAVAEGLDAPTMVAFDDQGRMLIAESGYGEGGEPKVTRIEKDGKRTALASGADFGTEVPVTAVAFHEGKVYVTHAGTVSRITDDGKLEAVITGLPGQGDHQANQLVFKDGYIYVAVGTVTNSGVVGPDNAVFGWLNVDRLKNLHDVPCRDVVLTANATYESDDVSGHNLPKVKTSAYAPFGTELPAGATVPGNVKCNGAVLRARLDGSGLEVYASGLRNPYGLKLGPDNQLYATNHAFDARGSRPIENAPDCFYRIEQGAWYGSPDYACDEPVTDPKFKPKDKPQPQFLIANHPADKPHTPIAKFTPHAATNGFAFAPSRDWGKPTDAFIALFGDMVPGTGTVGEPAGYKIVRVDSTNGNTEDFITNKLAGAASRHSAGGFEHPSDVAFGPDNAMYIADWGVARVTVDGLKIDKGSGVVWKVSRTAGATSSQIAPTKIINLLLAFVLIAATWLVARGNAATRGWKQGLGAGAVAGLVMGGFTMFVLSPLLELPWYAPPRALATFVMGRDALADILHFEPVSFMVGTIVLVLLTAVLGLLFSLILRTTSVIRTLFAGLLFGLAAWALMQYFVFPLVGPILAEKSFMPVWYAVSFSVYGLSLGALLAYLGRRKK